MDLKKIADKAKDVIDDRGGVDSLKGDAQDLKSIASGEGSVTDKAKAAVEALKDPGDSPDAPATDAPAAAMSPAPQAEAPPAAEGAPAYEPEQRRRGRGGDGRGRRRGRRRA